MMKAEVDAMHSDLPPGPEGHPVLGCLPAFGADPLGTLLAGWQQFGDVVRFRGPVRKADIFLAVRPEHLDRVLSERHLDYPHTKSFDARFGACGGHGIITVEGERWVTERAALERVLAPERVDALLPTVAETAVAGLAELEELVPAPGSAAIDLQDLMKRLSLRMLGTCLFGDAWQAHSHVLTQGLETFIEHVGHKLSSPVNVPERVPNARNRRFLAARTGYDRAVAAIIAERRQRGAHAEPDILDGFLAAQARVGREGDDRWGRDQLTNHFAAGHQTVQAALSWTCHLLGTHLDVQDEVRDEARSVLVSNVPTREEVEGLELTRMVLYEVMRLYPPLSLQPRSPLHDDVLDGCRIPGGAPLFISSYLTHRHADHWEDPEVFRPERFGHGSTEGSAPGSYWPFSHGPRRCLGEGLAMVEMTLAIALLLRRYRIVLRPRLPVQPELGIALEPRGGVPAWLAAV
jgi:enediyne biosynthesis protein E7